MADINAPNSEVAQNIKSVAIYARCSTSKQDLESQRDALIIWAKKTGQLYTLYEDYAVSGRQDSRKGINKLLEDAQDGRYDKVGILELSRIGRSIKFIYEVIETLQKLKVKLVLTNNNAVLDYGSLEGRALIGGLALAADIEWMLISERNARGRQAILIRGIKVGRKKKDISLQAIKALKEKGMSLNKIAKELKVSTPTIMRRLRDEKQGRGA